MFSFEYERGAPGKRGDHSPPRSPVAPVLAKIRSRPLLRAGDGVSGRIRDALTSGFSRVDRPAVAGRAWREAAAACGVSRTTIRRRREAEDLPGAVEGEARGWLIRVRDLFAGRFQNPARRRGTVVSLAAGCHRSWSSSLSLLRGGAGRGASWVSAARVPRAARAVLRWSCMRVLPGECRRGRGVRRLLGGGCGGGLDRLGVRGRTTQVSSGPGAFCPGQAGQHRQPKGRGLR